MPISRKKACSACRDSKARCNLDFPCSRCSERGLGCAYERTSMAHGPYPSPRPILTRPIRTEDTTTLWNWDTSIFPPTVPTLDPWLEQLSGADAVLPHLAQHHETTAQEEDEPVPCIPETLMLALTHGPTGTLSQRRPKNPQTYLTSKLIFGQLTSYPRMMIDGKGRLPPFMFPQCLLEGGSVDECRSRANGNHACLGETLACCMSLLHMFFNRTEASSEFVWKSIYQHQRELHDNASTLDGPGLVQAMQVTIIYILIQASDMQSIPDNDVGVLIKATREIGTNIHSANLFQYSTNGQVATNRSDWVWRESIRRSLCILFLIELLLDVTTSRQRQNCHGYEVVPLPSSRPLWEEVDNATWRSRNALLAESGRGFVGKEPLRIGDLRDIHRKGTGSSFSVNDMGGEAKFGETEAWCETADEFGSLLWMAVMMEQSTI